MNIVILFLLDPSLVAFVLTENKLQECEAFNTLETFLTSSLWMKYKKAPRILYVEEKNAHTFVTLEGLSPIEKIFLWARRKFLTHGSSMTFFSWQQAIFFSPTIPAPLKEGAILKTTSLLLETAPILSTSPKNKGHFYYFFDPRLGLWQWVLTHKTILFHHFTPHLTEALLEDHFKKTQHHIRQMGVQDSLSPLNLSSLVSASIVPPKDTPFIFCPKAFFPTGLHKTLAAFILLGCCVSYNIFSINMWETQLSSSRQALNQMEEKIQTPSYQQWKEPFQRQRRV